MALYVLHACTYREAHLRAGANLSGQSARRSNGWHPPLRSAPNRIRTSDILNRAVLQDGSREYIEMLRPAMVKPSVDEDPKTAKSADPVTPNTHPSSASAHRMHT